MVRSIFLGFAALAALAASPAGAQPVVWAPLDGPTPADACAVAVGEDGALFFSSSSEVFRYDSSAGEWHTATSTFSGAFFDIATGPAGRVWAGTGGIWRSLNGGQTWDWFPVRTAPHSGTPAAIVRVAVGPDATVYASRYRSTNEGASWPEMSLTPLAMAFIGSTAYAGTVSGMHRSTNAGASWVPSGLGSQEVTALAASGAVLAAATSDRLWRSTDGATWTEVAALAEVRTLASADGAFWAAAPDGLYRSADGTVWPATPAVFAGQSVLDVAANGEDVLAVVDGVPHHSTDRGATWTALTSGLTLRNATAAFATETLVAVSAAGNGPFASIDAGTTWVSWRDGLPFSVSSLFADPGAGWAVALANSEVFRAPLSLGSWEAVSLPEDRQYEGLAFGGEGRFYVSAARPDFEGELYRSTDGGASWEVVQAPSGALFGAVAGGGGTVMAATGPPFVGPSHLLVSTDGGTTWMEQPYPSGTTGPHFVDDDGRLYVGAANSLIRSDDGGATWMPLGSIGPAENHVRSLLDEPGSGLCLGTDLGVYCSSDDGASFVPANDGLPAAPPPVVALLRQEARYIALTEHAGVFVSGSAVAAEPLASPGGYALSALYPNPFNPSTRLSLSVAQTQAVTVAVYDALGRRVATLHDGPLAAGVAHTVTLDAASLPSGVYVVRAVGEAFTAARRASLVR